MFGSIAIAVAHHGKSSLAVVRGFDFEVASVRGVQLTIVLCWQDVMAALRCSGCAGVKEFRGWLIRVHAQRVKQSARRALGGA